MATVLVIGGAGYIGSHMVRTLADSGHNPIVFDNLISGHADTVDPKRLIVGDLNNSKDINRAFEEHPIDVVMHFASSIEVAESVTNPRKYYHNNVLNTILLLDAMIDHQVNKFVFSSSAAVYGEMVASPIKESADIRPTSPYGKTKAIIESLLVDYHHSYDLNTISLRYFNAAGADPKNGLGERHNPETHLIPLAIQAALRINSCFTVFGTDYLTSDGTCIRDFVHVLDICQAHLKATDVLLSEDRINEAINLGNGNGFSVLEVVSAVERITRRKIKIIEGAKRKGDPAILVADSSNAASRLNWHPKHSSLDEIVATAWEFHTGLHHQRRDQ